ncbi:MAG TPA: phosphotransferase [Acetobacterium sp.]|uniref:phosphotransferase n=1 Tax=Acetobacterium sp. TaxID=1872094 RepID=UPI002F42A4E8
MKMDTSKMLEFKPKTSEQLYLMYTQIKEISTGVTNLQEDLDKLFLRKRVIEIVENEYDFGKVVEVFEIFGGYVNRSFGIRVEKNGEIQELFIRKYKSGVQAKEIEFEHELITFAKEHGLDIAAGIIPAADGRGFIKVENPIINGEDNNIEYYAVYDYLEGEDKYTWLTPYCTDKEFASMAEVMATFHNATRDFDPKGLERVELKILDFVDTLPNIFKEYAAKDCDNIYHEFFNKKLNAIIEVIEKNKIDKDLAGKMPYNPTHNDYHPGNVKFRDEQVVGIFDFDWSKIELRLFDVCLGMVYTCCYWEDKEEDKLRLDKCEIFLNAYEQRMHELKGLTGFTKEEKASMKNMMAFANMYLINWCADAYYNDMEELNDYEYLAYLKHQIKLMDWIEDNEEAIQEMVSKL